MLMILSVINHALRDVNSVSTDPEELSVLLSTLNLTNRLHMCTIIVLCSQMQFYFFILRLLRIKKKDVFVKL